MLKGHNVLSCSIEGRGKKTWTKNKGMCRL